MATHELHSSPETCHWGYFDSQLPPKLWIKSGDIATIHCLSGSENILPEPPMNVLPETQWMVAMSPDLIRNCGASLLSKYPQWQVSGEE